MIIPSMCGAVNFIVFNGEGAVKKISHVIQSREAVKDLRTELSRHATLFQTCVQRFFACGSE